MQKYVEYIRYKYKSMYGNIGLMCITRLV